MFYKILMIVSATTLMWGCGCHDSGSEKPLVQAVTKAVEAADKANGAVMKTIKMQMDLGIKAIDSEDSIVNRINQKSRENNVLYKEIMFNEGKQKSIDSI